ncbi:MAG: type I-E CRISPR-associated protein Cas7/Cse4/CasC [Planctomycetaceae bacterium]
MNLELHLLQNFAPSCLNRDDTNAPKDCRFGGYRRARISSQCIKRSIRGAFGESTLLSAEDRAVRSNRLVGEIATQLADLSADPDQVRKIIELALSSQKLTVDENGLTQYLLFVGRREVSSLARVIREHWKTLSDMVPSESSEEGEDSATPNKSARKAKADKKAAIPPDVTKAVAAVLDGGKAADLALFGRMLADLPDKNVDAASQVAHAISTNKVDMEMDYFTAVDDLKTREDDAGAGMLGVVEYNSSCFYRYANICIPQLVKNLQGDHELAKRTVEAFVRASVSAIPSGKQNTFAAHNPPSFVFAVVRKSGLWSLSNAFERPVRPNGELSLVQRSITELDGYWGKLIAGYGKDQIMAGALFSLADVDLSSTKQYKKDSLQAVIDSALKSLDFSDNGKESA